MCDNKRIRSCACCSMVAFMSMQAELQRGEADRRAGQLWQAQAAEKAARDAGLRKLYDDNPARPEYFAQFQCSHR